MYSSGGELHIELLTGQPQGSKSLWVCETMVNSDFVASRDGQYIDIITYCDTESPR